MQNCGRISRVTLTISRKKALNYSLAKEQDRDVDFGQAAL